MHKGKIYKIISILVLCSQLFEGCDEFTEDYNQPKYDNPIKIGVVGDVSASREQVENMFFGAQLAAEEINKNGGIEISDEIFDIELIFKNSAGSSEEGIYVTNQLFEQNVEIIVGPTFSSVAIEMAEYCIENELLMISNAASTPELSYLIDSGLVWRTCPSDSVGGRVSAEYCIESLNFSKAAILYREDRFGEGLSGIIKSTFEELDGSVIASSFPANKEDLVGYNLATDLNVIFNNQVDVVYIIAFSSDMLYVSNEIYNNPYYQSLQKKPVIFVNDGTVPDDLINNLDQDFVNTIMGITSSNNQDPNYIKYQENYLDRFRLSPSAFSENTYDAIYCLAYAMLMANSSEPYEISNHLREVSGSETMIDDYGQSNVIINVDEFALGKELILRGNTINYEGASGPINFDSRGDPSPVITIWKIMNSEYVEINRYAY